ncbi:MAG: rhomboid family intramembrane serine protease [Syntrophales bacterium]
MRKDHNGRLLAGVMGAYFVLFPRARILTFIPIIIIPWFIEIPAVFFLLWWFLLQLFAGTVAQVLPSSRGGVAWWGHIGGFIAGVLLVTISKNPDGDAIEVANY